MANDGSKLEIAIIDWEQKRNVAKTSLSVSDPKVLKAESIKVLPEYNRSDAFSGMWVLQTYSLLKQAAQPAGYSLHHLDKDLKE